MSLVEPLLPKEEVEDQNLEKYSNDPLANLERSVERLSVDYESFEFDSTSDVEFHEKNFTENKWPPRWRIKCAAKYGNKVFIGRHDGLIKIYDLDTKEEIVLKGHTNEVNCLHVKSSLVLVSGSRDKTIIIWNLKTYKQERVIKVDNEEFYLELTGSNYIFYGSKRDKLIRKWNINNENEASTLSGHEDGITCIKSADNMDFLVTGSLDQSIRVWNVSKNQELTVFKGEYAIKLIVISYDEKYILAADTSHSVTLWNIDKREMVKIMKWIYTDFLYVNIENKCIWGEGYKEVLSFDIESLQVIKTEIKNEIETIAFSIKSNLSYYGLKNNTVLIKDEWSNKDIAVLKDFDSSIYMMLLIGSNEEYLASIMENGKIKIHKILKEDIPEDFGFDLKVDIGGIQLTRDGKYLLLFNSKTLKIWNLIDKNNVFCYENITGRVKISYNDKYFSFTDKESNILYVYSFQEMKEAIRFDMGPKNEFFSFSFSKNSQCISIYKRDGNIEIFDIENKSKVITLEVSEYMYFMEINKTNEYLISADTRNLNFWNLLEKTIIKSLTFEQKIDCLVLSDRNNCVIISTSNLIEIWDFRKQIKIMLFEEKENWIRHAGISDDETYFMFAQNKIARIWSLEHMKEVDTVESNDSPIVYLDITKDNKYMLINLQDGGVNLWSIEEKRYLATIKKDGGNLLAISKFTVDGKSIMIYNNGQVRIHNIEIYVDSSNIDSYPYFCPGKFSRIFRQNFINWIKNPSKEQLEKEFLDVVIYPIGYNVLHSLCVNDCADLLSIVLNDGAEFFRDKQNKSPLSYALIKNSRRCIDEILNYVINLEDDKRQFYFIHQLREDIPLLFNAKPLFLVPFLELLFRRRADKDHIGFYEIAEELPMSVFSPVSKIYTSTFTVKNDSLETKNANSKENLIQFWGSPWGYNFIAGSDESLLLLKKIDECENQNIFQTLLVQSVIREKWDYLWPAIISISIIYWLTLFTMIWHIFDPNIYILSSFAALNAILAAYEFLQFITKPKDYVSEIWNLIDIIRIALSIMWAVFEFYDENIEWLSFAVAFFNFLRGLTHFRVFDFTRFYVRLILMALSDSFAFLIIFLYSNLHLESSMLLLI